MRGRYWAAAAAIGIAGLAQAALPPKYQRQRELEAVVSAAVDRFEEPVDEIVLVGDDRYRVTVGRCTVVARIVSIPMGNMVGARQFKVRLDRPVCR